jgi:GNAT superfamily N-acetyltransferase
MGPQLRYEMELKIKAPNRQGMLTGRYNVSRKIGHIDAISVLRKSRRSGLGRQLVGEFETIIAGLGAKTILGEAVEASIPFWTRLGYKVSDRVNSKGFYPMRKKL